MWRIAVGNWRRVLALAGLVMLVGLVAASPAMAADIRRTDQIVIGPDQVIDDDLYAFGSTVVIDGTVKGDVVAFAQQMTVNGTVEGDLIGAAQLITINGTVNDHARIAAQAIVLSPAARVGRGVMAASYSLEQQPGSITGGDMIYAGYQAFVAGAVSRDLVGAAQGLAIRGTIGRNIIANVGDRANSPAMGNYMPSLPVAVPVVPPGLTIDSSAKVGGQITYESRTPGDISPGAQVQGRVVQMAPPPTPAPVAAARTISDVAVDNLRRFLALLLVGLLLLWVMPGFLRNLSNTVEARPLPSLGWGIVSVLVFVAVVIAVVFVTILLAVFFGIITLGGLVPAILGLGALADAALIVGFFIFVGYIAQVVVSYLAGRWLVGRVRPGQEPGRFWPLVIGLILFVILTAIPVLGGLIGLIVDLLVLGALWIWVTSRRAPLPTTTAATG